MLVSDSSARRAAVDGRALAERVPVADLDPRRLAAELEVLRHEADGAEREEAVALADHGVAVDHHVRLEHGAPAEAHARAHDAERADAHARLEGRLRRDPRQRVDLGRGQGRDLQQQTRLRRARVAHLHVALEADEVAAPVHQAHLEPQLVAGHHRPPELRVVEADDADLERAGVGRRLQQEDAGGLGERLEDEDTRHDGLPREVAGKEVLGAGDVLERDEPPRAVVLDDAVDEHERVLGGQLPDEPSDLAGAHAGGRKGITPGADARGARPEGGSRCYGLGAGLGAPGAGVAAAGAGAAAGAA